MFCFGKVIRPVLFPAIICFLLVISGCASKPQQQPPVQGYLEVSSSRIQALSARIRTQNNNTFSWMDLKNGVEYNIKYLSARPGNEIATRYGNIDVSWDMLRRTNEEFLEILPLLDDSPELLGEKFKWFELSPRTLLTGYYEPYLEASLTPDPDYPYPLYSVPSDLKKLDLGAFHHRWKGQTLLYRMDGDRVVPYYDRGEIDYGGLLPTGELRLPG